MIDTMVSIQVEQFFCGEKEFFFQTKKKIETEALRVSKFVLWEKEWQVFRSKEKRDNKFHREWKEKFALTMDGKEKTR